MKKLLLTALLAVLCLAAKAQNKYVTGTPLHYEDVIKIDSTTSAKILYEKGLSWFADTYKDSKAVIQLKDDNALQITGRAVLTAKSLDVYKTISYMIKLSFKDGRMKYELYSFNDGGLEVTDGVPTYTGFMSGRAKKYYAATQQSISDYAAGIKLELVRYFTRPNVSANKKDNW